MRTTANQKKISTEIPPVSINTDEELAKFVEIEETRYDENSEVEQHYKYR